MALTIEDGTGVVGANSYVTLAEARAYASARGSTLPSDDAALTALLVRATDYLESRRDRYKGAKANGSGFLQWPRVDPYGQGLKIEGAQLQPTTIPPELKAAQCQAAIEMSTVDPLATGTGVAIKSETVGPITTVYALPDGAGNVLPSMPKVAALLAPLCRSFGGLVVQRA